MSTEAKTPEGGWSEGLGEHAANPPTPTIVGETVTALGKEWTVGRWENRLKAQFEKKIQSKAMSAIADMEGAVHPDTLKKYMSAYLSDRSAGAYTWGAQDKSTAAGSAIRLAISEIEGLQYALFLMLRRAHPDMTEQKAKAIFCDAPLATSSAIWLALGNEQAPTKAGANGKQKPPSSKEEPESVETLDP